MYKIPLSYAKTCLKMWRKVFPKLHDVNHLTQLKIATNLGMAADIIQCNVLYGHESQKYEHIFNLVYDLSIQSNELLDMVSLCSELLSILNEFDGENVYDDIYNFVRNRVNVDEFIDDFEYTFEWTRHN